MRQPLQPAAEFGLPSYDVPKPRDDERGSMLIVALGILALLSILALTFVKLMTLEHAASTNYVEGVRARLIAEGGLESALAQIKRDATAKPFTDIREQWVYAKGQYWLPLEESTHIRRNSQEENDSPRSQVQLDLRRASFAGILGRTYDKGIDQYKIKVIDAQTQFNLNSKYEETPPVNNQVYDLTYIRFLDALGVAISRRPTPGSTTPSGRNPILTARYPRGEPNAYRGGMAIYQFRRSREGGVFKSKTELLEVLESEDDYIMLKDYVTTKSWMNDRALSAVSIPNQAKKPWSDVDVFNPRSPINVNLASKEVIAANLAGISGRGTFVFASAARTAKIDEGTPYEFTPPAGSDIGEETVYDARGYVVYFKPFGFQELMPGTADAPEIEGAYRFADLIWQRVQTNPFRNFAEWEQWFDTTCNRGVFNWQKDGNHLFPRHDDPNLLITDMAGTPLSQTERTAIKSDPRFERWFYDAARSMIKSNMNPNARLSGWNPDAVVAMPVDKGGLQFMNPDLDDNNPNKGMRRAQSNEWCFAPKGVFEVVALGEVLGEVHPDVNKHQDINDDGMPDRVVYAQAKVRGILQLYDIEAHTTQRDFERKGGPDGSGGHLEFRNEVSSYPKPKQYWDPSVHLSGNDLADWYETFQHAQADGNMKPSDRYGYLQLDTLKQIAFTRDESTAVIDMGVLNDTTFPHFELLLQHRRAERPGINTDTTNLAPLSADTSSRIHNAPTFAAPYTGRVANRWGFPHLDLPRPPQPMRMNYGHIWAGTAPMDGENQWQSLVLTPDGYYNSILRPSTLMFRASDTGLRPNSPDPEHSSGKEEFNPNPATPDPVHNGVKRLAGLDPLGRGYSQVDINVTSPPTATPVPDVGGNVAPTTKGGVSFWYKPDFDWAARDPSGNFLAAGTSGKFPQDPRFCGLLGVSHVFRSKHLATDSTGTLGAWCRGTQMFVSRTTTGDIRITRLYYEIAGQPPDLTAPPGPPYNGVTEQPFVADPAGGSHMPISIYWDKCRTDPQYTWPPAELIDDYLQGENAIWRTIAGPRTDWWIARDRMQHFRANEWHHIALRWDDEQGASTPMRAWIDSQEVPLQANPLPNTRPRRYDPVGAYDTTTSPPTVIPPANWPHGSLPEFVRINHQAGNDQQHRSFPKDMISIGSIWRDQDQQAGLFKIAEDANLPANGTIDDVRFWDGLGGGNTISWQGHYEREGEWQGEFDLSRHFPSDTGQLKLGAINFTAYLPTTYGIVVGGSNPQGVSRQPAGCGSVTLSFRVLDATGAVKYDFPGRWEATMDEISPSDPLAQATGFQLTDDSGEPVTVEKTDRLVYYLDIQSAKFQNGVGLTPGVGTGAPMASPVVDDVSLTYLLPSPKLLLKERVAH